MQSLRRHTLTGLALALLLALTGVTLGHARGQTMAAGEVVLCSGEGAVTLVLDAEGRPTGRVHVCPDMALSLIAGMAVAPAVVPLPVPREARAAGGERGVRLSGAGPVEVNARGPPAAA